MNWDLIIGAVIGFIAGSILFAFMGISERSSLIDELYQYKKPKREEEPESDEVEFTGDESILKEVNKDE